MTKNLSYDVSRMTTSDILEALGHEGPSLRALGVRSLGLFGSYRRGTPHAESDLDFLVVFERPSFRGYMSVKSLLEALFDRRVDLVLEDSLKPRLRDRILREVVYAPGLSPVSR